MAPKLPKRLEPVVVKRHKNVSFQTPEKKRDHFIRKEGGIQWKKLLSFLFVVLLAFAVTKAPIRSERLNIEAFNGQNAADLKYKEICSEKN